MPFYFLLIINYKNINNYNPIIPKYHKMILLYELLYTDINYNRTFCKSK